ncbi:hypothetical protein [Nostoc sp. CMAA1605]|uniref:hypothetical protein n=1 Tax=Nostoc sp. CMAA1605 TaxID=2055159 RepID=UPI001F1BBDEA|nr:hypothetical protein [Nostoc sp. CMAA1605]MCF4968704.1 hypothetical protein [Nostoc sp. CMAA1605]
MPLEIPINEPSVTDLALLPKTQFNVQVREVRTASLDSDAASYERFIEIELLLANIKKSLINAAIERVFTVIQSAAISDINVVAVTPTTPNTGVTGIVNFYTSVDKSGSELLVNVYLKTESIRQNNIDEVLNRIKTYTLASVQTDLNP